MDFIKIEKYLAVMLAQKICEAIKVKGLSFSFIDLSIKESLRQTAFVLFAELCPFASLRELPFHLGTFAITSLGPFRSI